MKNETLYLKTDHKSSLLEGVVESKQALPHGRQQPREEHPPELQRPLHIATGAGCGERPIRNTLTLK